MEETAIKMTTKKNSQALERIAQRINVDPPQEMLPEELNEGKKIRMNEIL